MAVAAGWLVRNGATRRAGTSDDGRPSGRHPLVVRVTQRRTDRRKARRNEPVLRIPALPGPAGKTRAEILAGDARLGHQAAAFRGSRALAGKASKPGIMALNAIRAIAAQVTARAA